MDITQCGTFIAALRKERGLTQKQLAEQLGVTDKAVSRWETGKGLPDADTLLRLSNCFDVTVNELLLGERIKAEEVARAADKAVVNVLQDCDREKQKNRHLGRLMILFGILLTLVLTAVYVQRLICEIRGDGYSFSAAHATAKATRAAKNIVDGNYEKAVRSIGFLGQNRDIAKEQWCRDMEALFDDDLEIQELHVGRMFEDDEFIRGNATLTVLDLNRPQGMLYTFHVYVAAQDGIVFGTPHCIYGDEHGEEMAGKIGAVLSTWNAG